MTRRTPSSIKRLCWRSSPHGRALQTLSMQKNGRHDNSLCTGIKSGIEILSVNKKEMTLSGNHVKGGGSYESPSLYMGHVVERCADRSTGRLLQISYVVHVVLIPAFFLQSPHLCNMKQNGYQNAAFGCFALMPFYDIVSFTAATTITGIPSSLSATLHSF